MYGIVIGALLFFPWMLAIHIAIGLFRATRRRAAARKQSGEGGVMKRSSTVSGLIWFVGVAAQALVATTLSLSAEARAPGVVLPGIGAAIHTSSLTSGRPGDEQSPVTCNRTKGVDHDGRLDLICLFPGGLTAGFQVEDGRAFLKGRTVDGEPFIGVASIEIISKLSRENSVIVLVRRRHAD
jgi:hypothetical protein